MVKQAGSIFSTQYTGTPSTALAGTPKPVAATAAPGSSVVPAAEDHVHAMTTGIITLDNLSDVVITTPATNQVVEYNGSNFVNTRKTYIVCTSGTRPGTPTEGQAIYETDTDEFLIYHGTQWRRPWSQPWGVLFYAERVVGDSSTITFDVTSLTTGAFTPIANRLYKMTCHIPFLKTTTTGEPIAYIRTGAGADLAYATAGSLASTAKETLSIPGKVVTTTAVSVTYKVVVDPGGGLQLNVSANLPAFFLIEDIGPNGSPA